ncbi:12612_t:CDS:2 [Ambispora leptoticha]|uniref:12612_t:CDS:1 n=1 Tax=Ambispora leptoticha TaxID=144679 RepID=A0A9N9AVT7_9GLOM|nr:12612_t:CDS:2 [Ambispora leptoticha]
MTETNTTSNKISVFVSGGYEPLAKTLVKELYTRPDIIGEIRLGLFDGQMPLDTVRGGAKIAQIIPSKKETIESALKGIDAAFIWRTENEDENLIFQYIDAILEQANNDVKGLVILSSYDDSPNSGKEIEEYLVNKSSSLKSPPSVIMLKVPIFTHHFDLYVKSLVSEKILQLPIGIEGRFAPLDDNDFAIAITNLLVKTATTANDAQKIDPNAHIKTITLNGPKFYTGPELAEKLSIIRKEEISFSGTSLNEAEVFLSHVLPPNSESRIKRYQELYRAIRDGEIVNDYDYDLNKLLGGQQPRDVDAYFSEIFSRGSMSQSVRQYRGF